MPISSSKPMPPQTRRFFAAAGLALAGLAAAQAEPAAGRLAARVATAGGAAVASCEVAVVGQPISARCDAEGRFVIDPAPAPPFQIVVTLPGGAVSPPLPVDSLAALELVLPEPLRESVTVLSGVAPGLDLLPASGATLVSEEGIGQRAPERLVNVLESVAGASKLGEGADSVPALRGLGRGRTLILIDGARVTAERQAGPSATFVEPASLGGLEVSRGPGSVVYSRTPSAG